ncbi:7288_t:CDS:2 [Paraglomus occultum]|uniref:7288_t:CDS:1 n=1 Tax=Paraglomus occultum TaxID=144539 RepID=A0A9N9B8J4_9GLOM|nr:7288_t:CDS:2 [Paraglomus occultum]
MSITVYPSPASSQPVLTESVPYTILPAPFASVVVFSAAQHQQAKQIVAVLDQEIRNSGVKIKFIDDKLSTDEKAEYTIIMEDITPLYAKINRLIPLYYLLTKNSKKAVKEMLTMKYMIQRQFIALPEDKYVLRLADLKAQRDLLAQLEKFEEQAQKLSTEGGYAVCEVRFEWTKTNNNENADTSSNPSNNRLTPPACDDAERMIVDEVEQDGKITSNISPAVKTTLATVSPPPSPLPPPQTMPTGARALAKFLSLIPPDGNDNNSIEYLSDRVGDLFIPMRKNNNTVPAATTGNANANNVRNNSDTLPLSGITNNLTFARSADKVSAGVQITPSLGKMKKSTEAGRRRTNQKKELRKDIVNNKANVNENMAVDENREISDSPGHNNENNTAKVLIKDESNTSTNTTPLTTANTNINELVKNEETSAKNTHANISGNESMQIEDTSDFMAE